MLVGLPLGLINNWRIFFNKNGMDLDPANARIHKSALQFLYRNSDFIPWLYRTPQGLH